MTNSVFAQCAEETDDQLSQVFLLCVVRGMQTQRKTELNNTMTVFLILASALVFFMQAGFAMLCAGSVRLKNVQNTMLKNILDACGAAIGFFTVGYAFAFGDADSDSASKTFIGHSNFFMMDLDHEESAVWLFQFAFAATSATIVAGTLAERCQMAAYLCYSILLTGFVYPVVAHAVWNPQGFLSAFSVDPLWGSGMLDFAGSGVVHVTGGLTALFATIVLGPRRGRFHDARGAPLDKPTPMPGHSVALQVLGTFILWLGWYGFNPGSALTLGVENHHFGMIAGQAAVNTTLSAASAGVASLFLNLYLVERDTGEATFDLQMIMNGALGGLVAITSGCALMDPWYGLLTGIVAGPLYLGGSRLLIRLRLDDAVDAIPVHLVCGVWGVIATGLFASADWIEMVYRPGQSHTDVDDNNHAGFITSLINGKIDATLLACQLTGLLFIFGWIMILMFPFFIFLNYVGWFRADSLEELVGLDISYHGGLAVANSDDVKNEYMQAFNRQRGEIRKRRTRQRPDPLDLVEEAPPNSTKSPGRRGSHQSMRSLNSSYHSHSIAGEEVGGLHP